MAVSDSRTLTVAIPTWNRATALRTQLAWLKSELAQCGQRVTTLVSDNASNDATPSVIENASREWPGPFVALRQPKNRGLIGNWRQCVENNRSEYIWCVGDDDEMNPGAVAVVLDTLREWPSCGVCHLNYGAIDGRTGAVLFDRLYPATENKVFGPGEGFARYCLSVAEGGPMFITANVMSAAAARASLAIWRESDRNLALPLFSALHAAWTQTSVLVGPPQCRSRYFTGSWQREHDALMLYDLRAVFQSLGRCGQDLRWLNEVRAARYRAFKLAHALYLLRARPGLLLSVVETQATRVAIASGLKIPWQL